VSTGDLDWSLPKQGRHVADEPPYPALTDPSAGESRPVGTDRVGADAVTTGGTGPAGSTGDQGDGAAARSLRRLQGLLRRDRFRGGVTAGDRSEVGEPALLPQDEEYVDWVAQLGQPEATAPSDPGERRTLRPRGRHQHD
jgi:hypothetical protein